jgi:hypothetical protein
MTHRATGEDRLSRDSEEPNYREPPLIGISAPWRWQAEQNPAPPQESAEPGAAFKQLAEVLRPYGFRWPHERQASQPAGQLTAESLFLQVGQSQIAYLNWKTGTQPNLRLVRLFLLMQRGWSTAAIEDAISEPALASWWLSGEATAWGVDPLTKKASQALVSFLRTKPEQIETTWRQRLQAEQHRPSAPEPNPKPTKPALLSSREVADRLEPAARPAFKKALWRAAEAFRKNGCRKPEPLGGAGEGWALAELGSGGHGRGHLMVQVRIE